MKPDEIHPAEFIHLLRQSSLVDDQELNEILALAPKTDRAKHLARFLVKRDVLTRFQAQHLLAGHSGGFLLGQYRVLDLIGRGGMGKVFKAEHMTMSRLVALKVLNSEVTRTERARQLFRREVRAAGRLVHPNIATAFDANEVNGRAFLVLEYVSGPSLSQLVREQGPLSVGMACELIRQAALGLQHAFELGMVHRDIKPSNLLIQPPIGQSSSARGTLKIVDFGLALLPTADGSDDTLAPDQHTVLGTPDYLSPEQARDLRSVDIRADLYSLGCTFYYLLSGHPPFPDGTAIEKLTRHATVTPKPIEDIRPIVSEGVAAIVRKLLEKEPGDRFQSPKELAEALRPFCETQPGEWSGERRALASVDEFGPVNGGEPETGTPSGMLSAAVSLEELAMKLSAAERSSKKPVASTWRTYTIWFLLALLGGFLIGVVLIAASSFLHE